MEKIWILCNGYGVIERGAERYTKELYNLLKDDYETSVTGAKTLKVKTRLEGRVPWRNGRAYAEAYRFGKEVQKVLELTKTGRPDLILNNSGFVGSYWCRKIRKKYKIPFITFERGGGREERLNNLFKPDLVSYLTKYSYNKSTYKNKVYLPIGIDPRVSEYEPPVFLEGKERPLVLSPSALVRFKRVDATIKAFSGIRGTLIQTSNGDQRIVELGKSLLGEHFLHTGRVPREVLDSLFQHCDLMVNASEHEAFGIVYLEAMRYNIPIVTQNDARRREIVGKAGLYCNCANDRNYKNTIMDAILTNWKERPRKQALKYDWKKLKPKYKEAIESLLKR